MVPIISLFFLLLFIFDCGNLVTLVIQLEKKYLHNYSEFKSDLSCIIIYVSVPGTCKLGPQINNLTRWYGKLIEVYNDLVEAALGN